MPSQINLYFFCHLIFYSSKGAPELLDSLNQNADEAKYVHLKLKITKARLRQELKCAYIWLFFKLLRSGLGRKLN